MQLFYSKDIDVKQSIYTFDKIESRHIIKVLRKNEGDKLYITNGRNSLFVGEIIDANDKKCQVELLEHLPQVAKRNYKVTIAIAPTKNNNRLEWFLEKATEIGIDNVQPILCEHSERKVIKTDRLQKVMVTAMKQSKQYKLPDLQKLRSFKKWVTTEFNGQKLIAQCLFDKANKDKNYLQKQLIPNTDVLLFIGPEGGFSDKEIKLALQNDFIPVSLGDNRLRTETAGIVAVQTIHLKNEL